jgi:hypothetical protein
MTTYGGVEAQLHAFLNLGTRWRRVMSFMPWGKDHKYPLDRRLGRWR